MSFYKNLKDGFPFSLYYFGTKMLPTQANMITKIIVKVIYNLGGKKNPTKRGYHFCTGLKNPPLVFNLTYQMFGLLRSPTYQNHSGLNRKVMS